MGQVTDTTVGDNLRPPDLPSNTSVPVFPATGMEPVCTADDLPPEARCNVLVTIREEDEENDNEDQECGSNRCMYGNDCNQTDNVRDEDDCDDGDDGLDDYPFDY